MGRRSAAVMTSGIAVAVLAVALGGCASSGSSGSASGSASGGAGKNYTIAMLAASAQNGYNQAVYTGVKKEAAKLDPNITVKLFDGNFNSQTQLSQLQDVTSNSQYAGVVVVPNDGPTLAGAFPTVNQTPVVAVLNPIGPKANDMQPQEPGVISTVAVSPAAAAKKQAEGVVTYCAKLNPCRVAILVGNLSTTLDVDRRNAYESVLNKHPNIKVVSVLQGKYDKETSLTAVSDMLQANPHVNVILSNADQQTEGAQIALQNAGINPKSVYLTGAGGTVEAVKMVREGIWKADYINFPVSMGKAAMDQLYNKLTGKKVSAWVNADKVGTTQAYADKATLAKTPNFTGEWTG